MHAGQLPGVSLQGLAAVAGGGADQEAATSYRALSIAPPGLDFQGGHYLALRAS